MLIIVNNTDNLFNVNHLLKDVKQRKDLHNSPFHPNCQIRIFVYMLISY